MIKQVLTDVTQQEWTIHEDHIIAIKWIGNTRSVGLKALVYVLHLSDPIHLDNGSSIRMRKRFHGAN